MLLTGISMVDYKLVVTQLQLNSTYHIISICVCVHA